MSADRYFWNRQTLWKYQIEAGRVWKFCFVSLHACLQENSKHWLWLSSCVIEYPEECQYKCVCKSDFVYTILSILIRSFTSFMSVSDHYVRSRGQSHQDVQGQQPGLHHGGASGGGAHRLALAPGPGGVCAQGDGQGVSLDRGQQALPEGQGSPASTHRGAGEELIVNRQENLQKLCL